MTYDTLLSMPAASTKKTSETKAKKRFIPHRAPGEPVTQEHLEWFYSQVRKGHNPYVTGGELNMSRATVRRYMKLQDMRISRDGVQFAHTPIDAAYGMQGAEEGFDETLTFPDPMSEEELNDFAAKAFHDFGYFRQRYLGRRHVKWQIEMALVIMSWVEYGQKTNEVVKGILNTAPGGGKTTTVTHDFPSWMIARNRDIRIALGSRTSPQAEKYTRRLRTTLERNILLNMEFGRFKPLDPDIWRKDQYTVDGATGHAASLDYKLAIAGLDHTAPEVKARLDDPEDEIHRILEILEGAFLTGEKEATVQALSQDMGFLGGRFDLNLWDDLCDRYNSRTPEQRESLTEWWFAEAESRCEPGGVVGLIGTRFGKYDLYRYCRDLTYQSEDELEDRLLDEVHGGMSRDEIEEVKEELEKELVDRYGERYGELIPQTNADRTTRPVYRYVKFPAHDEAKCKNPDSLKNTDHIDCVLDPKRFSFRHINRVRAQDPRKFRLTYQQDDETTEDNLVQEMWLTGGQDAKTGEVYPGCYDYDRKLLELPSIVADPESDRTSLYSVCTVDPSANNWWAMHWWIYDQKNDRDYLIDTLRARLHSGGFLDWDNNRREYRGLMNEWQQRSLAMNVKIGLWVIEQTGFQKWLTQYKWFHEWQKRQMVMVIGHDTGRNKADPELGVETLSPRYRYGLVDLPYASDLKTRVKINEFKKELTEYPDSQTDDMVMSHWFLQVRRDKLPKGIALSSLVNRPQHPYASSMPEAVAQRGREASERALGHHEVQQLLRRGV